VQTVTYPNGQTTTYAYYPVAQDLRLQEIHHKKPDTATLNKFNYTHDAVGNVLTWAQQTDTNPAQTYSFEYDRADQLLAATLAAATPKRYRYGYDPAGNRTVEQIDDAVTDATFDNMNRLSSQVPGGALTFRGTVNDPATVTVGGKPASVSGSNQFSGTAQVPSGTSQVTVQATDPNGNVRTNVYEVTQTGASNTFSFDANGSLIADGTKTYEWDAENRLTRVCTGACQAGTDPPNMLARFTYDGKGRRATKTAGGVTTSYVYSGGSFLEERPSAGWTKRYVYRPGIDRPLAQVVGGATTYYVADHLGSIVRTTDSLGTPTLTRQYDPWGNPIQGATTSGYAFTGREWDSETSLYYYRARYYDPKGGRFVSEDPSGLADGPNLFVYVRNRPLYATDPSGLKTFVVFPQGGFGHSAVMVNNGNSPALYDPGGSYEAPGWDRHVTDVILYEDVNLGHYIQWHEAIDQQTAHVYTFCTRASEEAEIFKRINNKPTAVSPGLCAQEARDVITGVGPFVGIGTGFLTPAQLEAKIIDAASKR